MATTELRRRRHPEVPLRQEEEQARGRLPDRSFVSCREFYKRHYLENRQQFLPPRDRNLFYLSSTLSLPISFGCTWYFALQIVGYEDWKPLVATAASAVTALLSFIIMVLVIRIKAQVYEDPSSVLPPNVKAQAARGEEQQRKASQETMAEVRSLPQDAESRKSSVAQSAAPLADIPELESIDDDVPILSQQ